LVSREYFPEGSQGDELDFRPTEFKDLKLAHLPTSINTDN